MGLVLHTCAKNPYFTFHFQDKIFLCDINNTSLILMYQYIFYKFCTHAVHCKLYYNVSHLELIFLCAGHSSSLHPVLSHFELIYLRTGHDSRMLLCYETTQKSMVAISHVILNYHLVAWFAMQM